MPRPTTAACLSMLLLVGLTATGLGCRGGRTPHGQPEDEYWRSMHGQPGTPVIVDGERWALLHEATDPLLLPGATLVGLVRWDERWVHPPKERVFVRGQDGRIMPIRRSDDLKPHLAPITSGDQALRYADLLRIFFRGGSPPGLPPSSPNRYGVIRELMEEQLAAEGIAVTPRIEEVGGAFLIRRLVLVENRVAGRVDYALVRIRERVACDGGFEAEILETVETAADVDLWVWKPL